MRFSQPPILAGRLDGGSGFRGLAKRLDRNTRRRGDQLTWGDNAFGAEVFNSCLSGLSCHLSTSS
jgi:hypothetical protein